MRKKLGTMLVEAGAISEQSLRAALNEQKRWGGSLGRTLVEMKLLGEDELVRILALQLNLPTIDLDTAVIPQTVIELVPADVAEHHGIVPFAQPMKFLDVAMADPTNVGVIDEIRILTRLNVRSHLAGPKMIERAISKYYARGFSTYQRGDAYISLDPSTEAGELEIADDPIPISPMTPQEEELVTLQERVARLESRVDLDVQVLQKIISLLVDKKVATREEIIARLR